MAIALYAIRVYLVNGWFIVTYGLGIFLLNNFIGFLSPQVDPEGDGPLLPVSGDGDFKPFSRRVPEFKFWYSSTKGVIIAFFMTFFSVFDARRAAPERPLPRNPCGAAPTRRPAPRAPQIPVFWPILLVYFFALFFLTMKRQIKHMIKHKYVPWSWGKKSYLDGGGSSASRPAKDDK